MVVDYQYYTDTYLNGKDALLDSASFAFYENQAELILDERIMTPYQIDDKIKMCLCELAESIKTYSIQADIASESVGDYSVKYNRATSDEQKKKCNVIIRKYLAKTGLLYTGVY